MKNKIVEMIGINKTFPNVKAVEDGKFDLYAGEIHSLIGENGAGKSTMMKMLYGVYTPDSGEIIINGRSMQKLTSKEAIGLGIGMVHQEFMLVKELTVLENIILGFEPVKGRLNTIDFDKAKKKINTYIEKYGLKVDLNKKVADIPVGEAQRVEIIKTLYRGANILIMDEPTAVLTPQETVQLLKILDSLRASGKSIIFISHKLNEVMEISDRITVMRHGHHVCTTDKASVTIPDLAKMMVGREVFLNVKKQPKNEKGKDETLLEIKDIYVPGDREHSKLRGLSLNIKKGEILGIAGVDGNGQNELVEAISGLRKVEKGEIIFKGKCIQGYSPLKIRQAGISHIPADRNKTGLNKQFTIRDNLVSNCFYKKPYSSGIKLNMNKLDQYAEELIKKYDIRPTDKDIRVGDLSGGNAQKVICAREIDGDFDLLIAAHPTRGVDIGSIEAIRNILNKVRQSGKSVLLVSADLEEILSLSDRIAVMYEGKITGIVDADKATEENIGLLMTGGKLNEER